MQGENAFLDLPNVLLIGEGRKVLKTFELEVNLVVDHKVGYVHYLKAKNGSLSRERWIPLPREVILGALEETKLMIKKVKREVDKKYHRVFSKFEGFIKNAITIYATTGETQISELSSNNYFSVDFWLGLRGYDLYEILKQIPSSDDSPF